jgi:hypothetical protein
MGQSKGSDRRLCWRPAAYGVLLSLAAAWPASFAAAQGACTEIESDAERLACYDRALRPARPAQPGTAPAQPAAPVQPDAAAPVPLAAPAAAAQQAAPQPAAEPAPAPVAGQQPAREPRSAAAPAAPTAPSATSIPASFAGHVVVVATREAQGRAIVFTTEDGDVWVQTDAQRTYLPDLPFPAEIKDGLAGSYFIVPERGRAVRVRRAQ